MIHWEDKLYGHKYFAQGAMGSMKCYLKIIEGKITDPEIKSDPLNEAYNIASKVLKYHEKNIQLNEISAQIFILKEKWSLALRSLLLLKTSKEVDAKKLEELLIERCNNELINYY